MAKSIAIYNRKGGVGKSTISTQIAHGLSLIGYKTLLVNLDGQNDSIRWLGIFKEDYNKTLYELFDRRKPVKLSDCILNARENLDVLPSSQVGIINSELAGEKRIDLIMQEKFADIDTLGYQYIVFDCSPQDCNLNDAALCYVDYILMPVQLEEAAVEGASNVYDVLNSLRIDTRRLAMVIPNMMESKRNHCKMSYDALKSSFGDVLTEPIPKRSSISDAGAVGKTVFEYDKEIGNIFFDILERLVKQIG